MKQLLIILGILLFLPLAGYAFGLRFHPEALQSRMGYEDREFRKINLKSGRSFVGEVLSENADSLKITFEGGAMIFMRHEILSVEPIDPKKASYGEYADEVVLLPKKPVFTFRREDSFFYKPEKKKVRYIDSNLGGRRDGSGGDEEDAEDAEGGGDMQEQYLRKMNKMMKFAEQAQEKADQQRAESEEMVAALEGGMLSGGGSDSYEDNEPKLHGSSG